MDNRVYVDLMPRSLAVPIGDRLRMVDMPVSGADWSADIPTSVNDTYGDPFIPEQVENTVAKINLLRTQRPLTAIFTKAGPHDGVVEHLKSILQPEKVIVFYSLTGLDEGDISFDERCAMLSALTDLFPHLMVFARPIIGGRNDHEENLVRLVRTASDHGVQFVLGGLHDRNKRKILADEVEERLLELCDEAGVPAFYKTSCAAAWASEQECWVHELGTPVNLDVAAELGYAVAVDGDGIALPRGTTGDINFLRMLCRCEVYVDEVISNYNVLTMPLVSGILLEATSSWFAWSENIEVCLDCDYCIIKQIEYLRKSRVSVGVHPSRLPEVVDREHGEYAVRRLRGTKLNRHTDRSRFHRYGDLRTTKPCTVRRYPPLEASAR